jgi:hypothetical protein
MAVFHDLSLSVIQSRKGHSEKILHSKIRRTLASRTAGLPPSGDVRLSGWPGDRHWKKVSHRILERPELSLFPDGHEGRHRIKQTEGQAR